MRRIQATIDPLFYPDFCRTVLAVRMILTNTWLTPIAGRVQIGTAIDLFQEPAPQIRLNWA